MTSQCVPKNVPNLSRYNSDIHQSIFIIFGTNVTEKVGNHNVLYFSTSPNYYYCYLARCKNTKIASFLSNAVLFHFWLSASIRNKIETSSYFLRLPQGQQPT